MTVALSSVRSARVRALRQLARRSARHEQRTFLAEGLPSVREAVDAVQRGQARVQELLVSASPAEDVAAVVEQARTAGIHVGTCSAEVLAALSETVTPQGAIAVCDFLDVSLDTVLAAQPGLVLVLAAIRDPGNAGAVVRVADAAGADAVIVSTQSVDPYNGKAVRSAAGSLFHVPLVIDADLPSSVASLRAAGLQILAADGSGACDLDDAEHDGTLAKPTAWIFGNEAWGLPDELLALADHVVRIPLYGRAESLNLATAAALCGYASARAVRLTTRARLRSDGL